MSQLVKETLGDDDDLDGDEKNPDIPLPNVSADVLGKVIEFCRHYQQTDEMRPIQTPLKSSKLEELVQEWYAEFVQVDKNLLFDLVAAANFMDIKPLLDLTCLAVSIMIKGKSATELRHMFNISHEYSAEEQAQIARENNRWIEQPPTNGNMDNPN
jgi:S-phase kinase-associated protein 1